MTAASRIGHRPEPARPRARRRPRQASAVFLTAGLSPPPDAAVAARTTRSRRRCSRTSRSRRRSPSRRTSTRCRRRCRCRPRPCGFLPRARRSRSSRSRSPCSARRPGRGRARPGSRRRPRRSRPGRRTCAGRSRRRVPWGTCTRRSALTDKASTGLSGDPPESSVESGLATNGDAPAGAPCRRPEPPDGSAAAGAAAAELAAARLRRRRRPPARPRSRSSACSRPTPARRTRTRRSRCSRPPLAAGHARHGARPARRRAAALPARLGSSRTSAAASSRCASSRPPAPSPRCPWSPRSARASAGRTVGLVATVIVAASWVVLYQAVFGRMYALFLLTSALSYLALSCALEHGGGRRWALWGIAVLARSRRIRTACSCSPRRGSTCSCSGSALREAILAFARRAGRGHAVLGRRSRALAALRRRRRRRRREARRARARCARYLRVVAEDFLTSNELLLGICLGFGLVGLLFFARSRRVHRLLVGSRDGGADGGAARRAARRPGVARVAAPDLRAAVPRAARGGGDRRAGRRPAAAAARVRRDRPGGASCRCRSTRPGPRTPELFNGKAHARARRARRGRRLARRARRGPDDVLFGYDPVFLLAWERQRDVQRHRRARAPTAGSRRTSSRTRAARPRGLGAGRRRQLEPTRRGRTIPLALPEPTVGVRGPRLRAVPRDPHAGADRHAGAVPRARRERDALGVSLAIVDDEQNLQTIELRAGPARRRPARATLPRSLCRVSSKQGAPSNAASPAGVSRRRAAAGGGPRRGPRRLRGRRRAGTSAGGSGGTRRSACADLRLRRRRAGRRATIVRVLITTLGDLLLDVIVRLAQPLAAGDDADRHDTSRRRRTGRERRRLGGRARRASARFVGKRARRRGRDGSRRTGSSGSASRSSGRSPRAAAASSCRSSSRTGPGRWPRTAASRPSLRADELDPAWFDGCDWLHVAGYSLVRRPERRRGCGRGRLGARRRCARLRRPLVMEPDPRPRRRALPGAASTGSHPISCSGTSASGRRSARRDGLEVVLKRGARGIVAGGREFPALPAAVVDSTGAGDALAAGFLVGGPELGLEAAARCVAQLGAMP